MSTYSLTTPGVGELAITSPISALPDLLPVLEPQLQVVRLALLVVGVGQAEEIGADAFRDVHALKADVRKGAAG